jgi:hypothetical protein
MKRFAQQKRRSGRIQPPSVASCLEYTRLDLVYPNSSQDQEEPTNQQSLAHALPTFPTDDPVLALIVGVWDQLPDECKRVLIETAQASVSVQDKRDCIN